jgi:hypothetical protein
VSNALDRSPGASTPNPSHQAGTPYQPLPNEAMGAFVSDLGVGHSDDAEYWGPPRREDLRPPLLPLSQPRAYRTPLQGAQDDSPDV